MLLRFIVLFLLCSFIACNDNMDDVGVRLDPSLTDISVATDTFHISTSNVFVDADITYANPDSFLLGYFYDTKYGATRADILAQVNCPLGFQYQPNSVPDSALVVLGCKSSFGDSYSPIAVNMYEMNKNTFDYTGSYPTNIDPSIYCDRSILLGHRIVTAKNALTGERKTLIVCKLSDDFKNRFFAINTNTYTHQANFLSFFKGIYITTDYGTATMLNIRQIDLEYYYHYTYTKPGSTTTSTVKSMIVFPANGEVRQVNRILHPDTEAVKLSLNQKDSVNYISSPANIQTRITIPLYRIKQKMNATVGNKKIALNSAVVNVEEAMDENTATAVPQNKIQYLLLIKESAVDRFFSKKELPSDTCAILGQYSYADATYHYPFNVAGMIANELKVNPNATNLNVRLIPVRVKFQANTYGTSTNVSSISQETQMRAVSVRSGKNTKSAMRIKMVYSGF